MQIRIVENTENLRTLTAEKERINTELNMATQIQKGMLPSIFPPFPERKEFDLYATMRPAREVGGDFYDFFMIDEDHLALVMADVSGKGVPGALFMMVSKVILKNNAMAGKSVGEILAMTNDLICANNQMEMFVTVWMGILEISTGKIKAANAGHEYPAVMKDGRFGLCKDKHSFVIGGLADSRYREYELQMEKGDKLFLYTDGVTEATSEKGELFGTERISFVELSESLVDEYLAMVNDYENVNRFIGGRKDAFTREQEIWWVRDKLDRNAPVFSMIEKKTGRFIGNIELMDLTDTEAELGIALTAKMQEKGLGAEAILALGAYAADKFGLKRIYLRTAPFNSRAIHVYEKCGFKEYSRTEDHVFMEKLLKQPSL